MSEQAEQTNELSSPQAKAPGQVIRNPYELVLGLGGAALFFVGLIISASGTAAYKSEVNVTDFVNSMSGGFSSDADVSGLLWATFGNQMSTVGVVILLGMAFYFMTRWNAENGRSERQ